MTFNWDQYDPESKNKESFNWDQYDPESKNKTLQPQADQRGFLDRTFESFGKGLAYQSQISNAVKPSGAAGLGRGLTSGVSFGLSENIPGFQTTGKPEEVTGELGGSVLPIHFLGKLVKYANTPFFKLAEKSPIFSKSLESLLNIFTAGETGAAYKGTTDIFKGEIPKAEDLLVHGAEWAALDAILRGLGFSRGKFIEKLVKNSPNPEKPQYQILNDFITENKESFTTPEKTAAKVLSILEQPPTKATGAKIKVSETPPSKVQVKAKEPIESIAMESSAEAQSTRNLSNRKFEPQTFDFIERKADLNAESYLPGEILPEKIENRILDSGEEEVLLGFGERAKNEQELGTNITTEIEKGLEEAEASYRPKYEKVQQAASKIKHSPKNTIKLANDILKEINALRTRPEGYQKVINNINDALSDMGYYIAEYKGKMSILDGSGKPIKLGATEIFENIPLSKSIELGKRLNKIIDFDLIGASIKNRLKPVSKSLKEEVKTILKNTDPEAFKLLNEADADYAATARKYGRESIQKVRSFEAKEKVAQLLKSPTALGDLKTVVSPKQYTQIEREVLEKLRDMNFTTANNTLRNIEHHLTPRAKQLAREIVKRKIPSQKSLPSQNAKLKADFINGLSKDIIQGKRPQNALDLWKTKKGQHFIKEALKNNPNKEKVINYLKKQSFFDFAKSVVSPTGKVDFNMFRKLMQDPATRANLELVGGKDAVDFFDKIESFSKQLEKNLKIRENLPLKELKQSELPTSKRGEYLLRRTAENLTKPKKPQVVGEEKIREIGERAKEEKKRVGEKYGEVLLRRKAVSEAPIFFKGREFFEGLPDSVKIVGSLFGLFTYGPLKYLGAAKATQYLYKIATRPKLRSDMIKAMNLAKTNKFDSLALLETIGDALVEKSQE